MVPALNSEGQYFYQGGTFTPNNDDWLASDNQQNFNEHIDLKDEYQLNKITVKEEFRSQKIGKLLFSHCLNQLINLNVKCVLLEVSSLNLIAQRFYKKLGFIRVGIRKKYYSEFEDALLYNLEIE